MIVEEREYLVKPGAAAEYARLWAELGREPQTRILGNLLGFYTTEVGELNTLVYLWGYESHADRAGRRAELATDPDFARFRHQVRDLLVRQTNRVLTPAVPL
ncbi:MULTISPECIES: NIPSNAP family protein [Streptomyces]|uniref:NIPSNAP family protein n=1 Tax=Streptomyces griseiscabiei TaxID=2993540 RepID=A0ABU4L6F2_9ACTN|nr:MULTISPECIES: NIPSNAP family protein [Streptomyces]MBZ3906335.1 NIPSNAP family protein [Streptomyces griseiscabiei]MDX2911332.1 NIPSNAP family protein [Streptomyces griseiscabiei]